MQEYSAEHGAKSTPGGAPARVWRARVFAAFAVLLPGLSLTILSGQYLAQQAEEQRRSDFEHQVSVATRNISSAVQRYTDFLYAYRAFFNASDTVSRAEFADYMMSLQRSERYPGIQALSFARALGHHQRGEFERTVRAELQQYTSELPDFVIHPPGIHPESYVIEYTEPLRQNARSLGLDLATERQRLISVQRARDTATPIATGMIQLLQDDERKPALAWRLALYKSRQLPLSVSERRRDFHGVVNAVVIIDKLLSGVLSGKLRDRLHLHIYDKRHVMAKLILRR